MSHHLKNARVSQAGVDVTAITTHSRALHAAAHQAAVDSRIDPADCRLVLSSFVDGGPTSVKGFWLRVPVPKSRSTPKAMMTNGMRHSRPMSLQPRKLSKPSSKRTSPRLHTEGLE